MTDGLNLARASCAAESSEGRMPSSARSRRQAASREIGVAPAFANSAAVADSASENKVAISLLLLRNSFLPNPPQIPSGAGNDHTGDRTGKDNNGPGKSLPQQLLRKYSRALEADRTDHFRSCNIPPKW